MTKRFKILDGALNYLRTNSTEANPDAPAGTPLKAYQDWKKGARNVTYDRPDGSNPEKLIDVAVIPFYFDPVETSLTRIPISKRVQDFTGISTLRGAANITVDVPAEVQDLRGFFPAQCTVSVPDASRDNPNAESSLTGVKYNKKGARSYTFPYGASGTAERESDVRANIRAAVPQGANYQLQFTSEKI